MFSLVEYNETHSASICFLFYANIDNYRTMTSTSLVKEKLKKSAARIQGLRKTNKEILLNYPSVTILSEHRNLFRKYKNEHFRKAFNDYKKYMRNKKIIDENDKLSGEISHSVDDQNSVKNNEGTLDNPDNGDEPSVRIEQDDNDDENSQDVDENCPESISLINDSYSEINAIAQEDAIFLTCENCRRKQCEELISNYGECYRIDFFR